MKAMFPVVRTSTRSGVSSAFYVVFMVLSLFFFASFFVLSAQDLRVVFYNIGNSLPTDLVKATYQDERGFVWIATDAGLLRFDGKRCVSYDNLPNPYIKGFLKTNNGDLLVMTDMGILKIQDDADTTRFTVVLPGSVVRTDSTILYPKSFYQDRKGILWIGEPDAVVRYADGRMKRYRFAEEFSSDNFARSFSFFEDKQGHVLMFSRRGCALFCFDPVADNFKRIPLQATSPSSVPVPNAPSAKPFRHVDAIFCRSDDRWWVGTDGGVFEVQIQQTADSPPSGWTARRLAEGKDISYIAADANGTIYVGAWYSGLYTFNQAEGVLERLKAVGSQTINDIKLTANNNLWVSADDGIALVQPTRFRHLDIPFKRPYIQHISLAPNGDVLATDGINILKLNSTVVQPALQQGSTSYKSILTTKEEEWGIFLSLAHDGDDLLVGTSLGYILRLHNGNCTTVARIGNQAIFFLLVDEKRQIWACQQAVEEVIKIKPNGQVEHYGRQKGITTIPQVVSHAPDKTIYVGGKENTFYRYDAATDTFADISIQVPLKTTTALNVNDIAVSADTTIWIGTTYGLLRRKGGIIEKIALPKEIARQNITSVKIAPDGSIFFTTEQTMNFYIGKQLLTLDLRSGNSTMTISYRNMVRDREGQLWVGTTQGVLFMPNSAMHYQKTPAPVLLSVQVNSTPVRQLVLEHRYEAGAYLEVHFASLSYPPDKIRYQTRVVGLDSAWSETSYESYTILPLLNSGSYTFQIRAQQTGSLWSDPTEFPFIVQPHWYQTWWAYMLDVVGWFGLVYGAARLRSRHLERRNRALKKIVNERTAEIQHQIAILDDQAREIELVNAQLHEQNVLLQELNTEKNDFLAIAAHDLKNPLTVIMMSSSMVQQYAYQMKVEEVVAQMTNVERTSKRMRDIIMNLLNINALETGKFTFTPTRLDIVETARQVAEDYRERATNKDITLYFQPSHPQIFVFADSTATTEILENLVSNAIKYSPHGRNVWISVTKEQEARNREHNSALQPVPHCLILVKDEGPGLSEEDMSNLFGKFVKLSARPTGGEHSTGLGLSIVKKMVESMKGKVWCESELGHGATFIVELPIMDEYG